MYAGAPCLCVWAIGDVVTSPRWREGGFFGRRGRAWRSRTLRHRRGGRGAGAPDRSPRTFRSSRTRPLMRHPRCRVARPESIRGGGRSRRRRGTRSPRQSKHPRRRRSLSNPAESSSPRRRRSSSRHRTRRTGAASTHNSWRRCPSRRGDRRGPARQKCVPRPAVSSLPFTCDGTILVAVIARGLHVSLRERLRSVCCTVTHL